MQLKGGALAYIEYQDGHPFQVITFETIQGIHGPYTCFTDYDIDWSKKYGALCIEEAGSGSATMLTPHDCTYWADPTLAVEPVGECTRLKVIPDLSFLEDVWECGTVYCSLCDDHYPEEPLCQCKHIAWCDACGWWSTPDEDCPHRSANNQMYIDPEEEDEEKSLSSS